MFRVAINLISPHSFFFLNKWFVFQSHRGKLHRCRLIMTKLLIKTRKRTAAFLAERKWDLLVRKAAFAHYTRLNEEVYFKVGSKVQEHT